ncbi:SapB/AmfS family lanthipeptide [Micromonospora sagamiensis]|nr:SapB/AmfS family lanthipeptide [Micromonospora sagamiensis]
MTLLDLQGLEMADRTHDTSGLSVLMCDGSSLSVTSCD